MLGVKHCKHKHAPSTHDTSSLGTLAVGNSVGTHSESFVLDLHDCWTKLCENIDGWEGESEAMGKERG